MATAPKSLTIRTYQVGFGDCFLLSFQYGPKSEKHVLVDFGSTGLPPDIPKTRMKDIALDIKKRTEGKLHAVVATHRHRDHISGFATNKSGTDSGDVIRGLKPDVVVQPWTEDPDLEEAATGPKKKQLRDPLSHVAALASMHAVAEQTRAKAKQMRLSNHFPRALRDQLSFLGENNVKNLSAVKNLMAMAKNSYVHHGSKSGLETVLPGVKVHVLGPPTLEQTNKIRKQVARQKEEFWHLQANAMRFSAAASNGATQAVLFPRHVLSRGPKFPIDTRWLVFHSRALQGQQLLQIVTILDDAMNNTSVILVFEVGGKRLLFPGDAQWENWEFALSDEKTKTFLSGVNLYKVGHHGSLNATPKSLWKLFRNRSTTEGPKRLKSLMSTMLGKHGSEKSGTEVPRSKLVTELKHDTDHFSTQELKKGELFHETVVNF